MHLINLKVGFGPSSELSELQVVFAAAVGVMTHAHVAIYCMPTLLLGTIRDGIYIAGMPRRAEKFMSWHTPSC